MPEARVFQIVLDSLEGHEISFRDHDQLLNKSEI